MSDVVPVEEELPGDIFTLVDPFESNPPNGFSSIEQSTRSQQIDDAFEKATKSGPSASEDDRGYSDSDDNGVDDEDIQINYVPNLKAIKPRTASVSFVTINQTTQTSALVSTVLPPPPKTLFPRYGERGGWMIKLSHQKGKKLVLLLLIALMYTGCIICSYLDKSI